MLLALYVYVHLILLRSFSCTLVCDIVFIVCSSYLAGAEFALLIMYYAFVYFVRRLCFCWPFGWLVGHSVKSKKSLRSSGCWLFCIAAFLRFSKRMPTVAKHMLVLRMYAYRERGKRINKSRTQESFVQSKRRNILKNQLWAMENNYRCFALPMSSSSLHCKS